MDRTGEETMTELKGPYPATVGDISKLAELIADMDSALAELADLNELADA
jgi:hypothetical protein